MTSLGKVQAAGNPRYHDKGQLHSQHQGAVAHEQEQTGEQSQGFVSMVHRLDGAVDMHVLDKQLQEFVQTRKRGHNQPLLELQIQPRQSCFIGGGCKILF